MPACPVALALEGRRAEAEAALRDGGHDGDALEAFCVRAALAVVADEGEALIGGADSETVLQLLAARGGEDGLDVAAALLAPPRPEDDAGEAVVLLDGRAAEALELARRYWRARPEDPLVVRRAAGFEPARLGRAGASDATEAPAGPMSLARARALAAEGAARFDVAVPGGRRA